MMTKQEVFDKVATHLLAQGRTSYIRPGSKMCAYRSDDGGMCAAGKLIDGENYCRSMEGKRADVPPVMRALLASGVNMLDTAIRGMVLELQAMHDTRPPESWPNHLSTIARQYNVNFGGALPAERQSAFREEWMRLVTPVSVSAMWVDEATAICDINMPTTALVTDRKPTHQLVPPDVTVEQWVAAMMALQPALTPDIDNDSQPAPLVAHKQGVTA